ncbi:MAG: alginate export family protein [Flavobacteriaceae bacterium]|nr:alginate export family protein [Flavobacteriaceae bacterium]
MQNIKSTLQLFFTITLLISTSSAFAQEFDLSAELRPRFESRNGFSKLAVTNADAANFISQRSRLNFNFKQEKLKMGIAVQNVRVWGDVNTLSSTDKNGIALHEAWGETLLTDQFSVKLGRQEIVYDDHRIFGNVGWAQQARSHDALVAKYISNAKNRFDFGVAYNANTETLARETYAVNQYKSFQYVWYNGQIEKVGISLLLLNNGMEYLELGKQEIAYSQTFGPRFTYKKGNLSLDAAAYLQSGKIALNDVSASYFTANANYKFSENFSGLAGFEYLSGKDMNDSDTKIKSFNPLYGTNHKFNGWMDYFYVGNHANSVGLTDLYFTLNYQKEKFTANVTPHFFKSSGDIYAGIIQKSANLGTEIDLSIGYKVANNINFNAGFSKMYATNSMEILKGGDKDEANTWSWLMVTFSPKLFNSK